MTLDHGEPMKPRAPRLTIVIVSYNTRAWLQRCLEAVSRQHGVDEVEVIVVDNASTDGSAEMVREKFPQFDLAKLDSNVGFSGANNVGAAQAAAPLLLFLNPDTEVLDGSLGEMLTYLEANPRCDVAGGKIYDETGSIERSTGSWPALSSRILDRLLDYAPKWLADALEHKAHRNRKFDSTREVDWVTGAYLWIRRSVFERTDGFDPDFFYYEDVDLCYRVRKTGGTVWFVSAAPITHYKGKAPVSSRARKASQLRSLRAFTRKHKRDPDRTKA
jgi:GT2 family glycosyltransferase